MPIAFWRDEYLTGNTEIDTQHQYLFNLINHLHDAMIEGKGNDILGDTLDQLVAYTIEHFATEEALMQKYGYPDFAIHKKKHDLLKQDVLDLQNKWKKQELFLSVKVSQFMTNWLIHHIKGEDLKIINFIRDKIHK